jgi:hypothetical protein
MKGWFLQYNQAYTENDMELNYYEKPWALRVQDCPCDLHFVQYLEAKKLEGKSIFHFGTGEHHLVGKNNHERGNPNEILGITASGQEHQAYIDFIINNPVVANYYKVLFGDIYTLSPRSLPPFDIVTLFHFAEFYDDQLFEGTGTFELNLNRLNSKYARLNDTTLLELFLSGLNPGGKILFYRLSDAFVDKPYKAAKIIDDFVSQGKMFLEEEYKSLLVYGRVS